MGRTSTGGVPFDAVPNDFSYSLLGNLAWELDAWGQIRRSTEASLADLLSREENRRAVVLGLVSGVAQAYFDLLQFDMQLDISRRALQSWEESLVIAHARLRRGLTSRLDADQFEAERARAAARVAEFERLKTQKENELSVLLGRNPMKIKQGKLLTEQVLPPEVPAGLPSELLQRRPDILQAEQELAAATARIGVAKANRFPKVTLTGILGVASPRLSNFFTSEGKFGASGFDLAGPLLAKLKQNKLRPYVLHCDSQICGIVEESQVILMSSLPSGASSKPNYLSQKHIAFTWFRSFNCIKL